MKLIADSGSTKCDWALISEEEVTHFSTKGLNPFFVSTEEMLETFKDVKQHFELENKPVTIYFYGAGCSNAEKSSLVLETISVAFVCDKITIEDDLKASVLAFNEQQAFICCILGTGSNACYFDGNDIVKKTPSLGYILGDEASGAYFGKKILQAYFYHLLPSELKKDFERTYGVKKDEVLENIYKRTNANVYLASYFKFLAENSDNEFIRKMVSNGFVEFLKIHVSCYPNHRNLKVNFIGSIAHIFREELEKAAIELGITIGSCIQKPIEGLVNYHKKV